MLPRLVALALLAPAVPLAAQQIPGYSPAAAARQLAAESAAIARPSPEQASAHSRALSAETHVAGTDAQARTRDYVIREMRALGLQTEVRTYTVWLPHATSVRVWRLTPEQKELDLREPPVAGDPASTLPQYPAANGYSADGDATGEVVYVNYGLIEDYARLDSLGVSVQGKIVLARYGRSYRGIKAREAEKRGAAALLLYTDPQGDGFVVGEVYPEGPMRPEFGIQRGSVLNGAGDPSTPGWPSTRGARREAHDKWLVPRIPVVPLSYGNAAELLRELRGTPVPDSTWQGGLPFPYHIGPGPVTARVQVQTDAAQRGYKEIWNTFGILRGTDLPDELVIIGAHRDAWGPGASDDVSGTVSVLEAARALAEAARAGNRPRRTVVFATWDAEEWGLIGSTEYVEEDSARLWRGAVAYLNQDVATNGPNFSAGGSPSLRATLRDVARRVAHPDGGGSVYDVWRRRVAVADSLEPPMGDPGGGSDFAGFYNHLGIPHADWGFGGPWGVYHSQYDSYAWMSRFGDPEFRRHTAAAQLGAALLLRLANAEVLPYDYVEFARTLQAHLPALDEGMRARGWDVTVAPLQGALARFERAAVAFARARDAALAGGTPERRQLTATNALLLRVERSLVRPKGLATRPWYRNLIYAADEDNGYATMVFPSVNEAVRAGNRTLAADEVADLAQRFVVAANALVRATEEISGVR